jgi:hypothetical protein
MKTDETAPIWWARLRVAARTSPRVYPRRITEGSQQPDDEVIPLDASRILAEVDLATGEQRFLLDGSKPFDGSRLGVARFIVAADGGIANDTVRLTTPAQS